MATAKAKSAKKTSKKKKTDLPLPERQLFLLLLGGALATAVVAYATPMREVFLSQYGVFSNAAILFYLVAFGYGLKGIYDLNLENWKRWRPLAILSLLALFMAGEELNWGLSLVDGAHEGWAVQSVRDLIALSLLGVPEGADIKLVGFIALMRWMLLLAVLYGLGSLFFLREKIAGIWVKARKHPSFFYGCVFVGLFVVGILMNAEFLPGHDVFGDCLRMCGALAFLLGSLQFWGKVKG
ncbi:MAG: hypothetical protein DHS20C02_02150 [Micavibrio sp.]|nr:MAG: hypothetical protein DHS20C02_02150 [Micavibrio sp.]